MGLFNKMRYDSVLNGLVKTYKSLEEEQRRKYFPGGDEQYIAVMESFSKLDHKDYFKTILNNSQRYTGIYMALVQALQDGYELSLIATTLRSKLPSMFRNMNSAVSCLAFVILNMNYHDYSMMTDEQELNMLFIKETALVSEAVNGDPVPAKMREPMAGKYQPTLNIPNTIPPKTTLQTPDLSKTTPIPVEQAQKEIVIEEGAESYYFFNMKEFLTYVEVEKPKKQIIWAQGDAYLNEFQAAYEAHEQGRYNDAIFHLRKSLELNPIGIASRFELITNYFILKQIDLAEKELYILEKYLTEASDKAHYYRSLGYIFIEKGMYTAAAASYRYSLDYAHNDMAFKEVKSLTERYNISLEGKDLENIIILAGGHILSKEVVEIKAVNPPKEDETIDVKPEEKTEEKAEESCTCPKCNKQIPTNSKFCPFCGNKYEPPVPKMKFCHKCGTELVEGSKFCHKCGARIEY